MDDLRTNSRATNYASSSYLFERPIGKTREDLYYRPSSRLLQDLDAIYSNLRSSVDRKVSIRRLHPDVSDGDRGVTFLHNKEELERNKKGSHPSSFRSSHPERARKSHIRSDVKDHWRISQERHADSYGVMARNGCTDVRDSTNNHNNAMDAWKENFDSIGRSARIYYGENKHGLNNSGKSLSTPNDDCISNNDRSKDSRSYIRTYDNSNSDSYSYYQNYLDSTYLISDKQRSWSTSDYNLSKYDDDVKNRKENDSNYVSSCRSRTFSRDVYTCRPQTRTPIDNRSHHLGKNNPITTPRDRAYTKTNEHSDIMSKTDTRSSKRNTKENENHHRRSTKRNKDSCSRTYYNHNSSKITHDSSKKESDSNMAADKQVNGFYNKHYEVSTTTTAENAKYTIYGINYTTMTNDPFITDDFNQRQEQLHDVCSRPSTNSKNTLSKYSNALGDLRYKNMKERYEGNNTFDDSNNSINACDRSESTSKSIAHPSSSNEKERTKNHQHTHTDAFDALLGDNSFNRHNTREQNRAKSLQGMETNDKCHATKDTGIMSFSGKSSMNTNERTNSASNNIKKINRKHSSANGTHKSITHSQNIDGITSSYLNTNHNDVNKTINNDSNSSKDSLSSSGYNDNKFNHSVSGNRTAVASDVKYSQNIEEITNLYRKKDQSEINDVSLSFELTVPEASTESTAIGTANYASKTSLVSNEKRSSLASFNKQESNIDKDINDGMNVRSYKNDRTNNPSCIPNGDSRLPSNVTNLDDVSHFHHHYRNQFNSKEYKTILHSAVAIASGDTIQNLIRTNSINCASVDTTDSVQGNTALHLACSYANHEAITVLLDSGAEYNTVNWYGETPLAKLLKHVTRNNDDWFNAKRLELARTLISRGLMVFRCRRRGRLAKEENEDRNVETASDYHYRNEPSNGREPVLSSNSLNSLNMKPPWTFSPVEYSTPSSMHNQRPDGCISSSEASSPCLSPQSSPRSSPPPSSPLPSSSYPSQVSALSHESKQASQKWPSKEDKLLQLYEKLASQLRSDWSLQQQCRLRIIRCFGTKSLAVSVSELGLPRMVQRYIIEGS